MEPLTSLRVVGRSRPTLQALPHALRTIEAFADASALHTLESTASRGLVRLLDRIVAREPSVAKDTFGSWRFDHGTQNAAASSQIAILEWWATHYRPEQSLNVKTLVQVAASKGQLKVLQWLHERYTIPPHEFKPNSLWSLASNYPDVVYWIHAQEFDVPVVIELNLVARTGDLAFMQWLLQHRDQQYTVLFNNNLLPNAMERSDLATVQWLLASSLGEICSEYYLSVHFGYGSSAQICKKRWPREYGNNAPQFYLPEPLEVTEDHLRVFRWLNNEYKWESEEYRNKWIDCVALHAASCNDFEVIKVLEGVETRLPALPRARQIRANSDRFRLPMWLAAFHGHLEMVQWLHTHGGKNNANDSMDGAATGGHLEIVQWLHDNQLYGLKKEIMDVAAWNGHLDILQWLYENAPEYNCTHRAMDVAAGRGHLAVVQWLHANRSEGCTKSAVDSAIRNGHLAVVQWLHANRSEDCSRKAINKAVSNGHVEVVEFLYSHRLHTAISSAAIDEAAINGHLTMVHWLQTNLSPNWTQDALDSAARNGHSEMVRYLVEHCGMRCSQKTIHVACIAGLFGLIEWLAVSGPNPEIVSAAFAPFSFKYSIDVLDLTTLN